MIESYLRPEGLALQCDIPLKDKNWFKTGGNARYFCEPSNISEFGQALMLASSKGLDSFTFGSGANLLVHDKGFNGVAIRPKLTSIEFKQINEDHWRVIAGSGVMIDKLIQTCLDNNFTGLDDFSGIPGTVGGAVFINLHYFGARISQAFHSGKLINKHTGEIFEKDVTWLQFGYNDSALHSRESYLVDATFNIRKVSRFEAAYHQGRRDEIIRHRNSRYPKERTCGSFFRNFFQHELDLGNEKATHPYIAYYLDKIGVKGSLRHGGAVVSRQHANMIITDRDNATSNDIINLARTMKKMVFEEFGISPKLECQLLGFTSDPLK